MTPCDDDGNLTVGFRSALRLVIVTHVQVVRLICNGGHDIQKAGSPAIAMLATDTSLWRLTVLRSRPCIKQD